MSNSAWLIAGFTLGIIVAAQPLSAAKRPEPAHVALIIGNSRYAPKDSTSPIDGDTITFPDLPNACNDAGAIAAALVANANWAESDITLKCDLTAGQMITEIRHFADKLRKPGSVGLIYFAGHGVQVADHNYLFGVGATPNAQVEATQFIINPDAPLFTDVAVDLHDDITRVVGNVTHGALVVILDACRQNPLLARVTAALNQRERSPGLITVSAPSSRTKTVPGIVIGYSTSDGDTALDGLGASSPYAEAFSRHIVAGKQIYNILSETATAVYNDSRTSFPTTPQNPTETGHFAEPPTWCLAKCPDDDGQPLSSAKSSRSEQVPKNAWRLAALETKNEAASASGLDSALPMALGIHNEHIPPDQLLLDRTDVKMPKGIASFNVDVYWCMGGPGEKMRYQSALEVGKDIVQKGAIGAFGSGLALNRVRARPLSIQANSTPDYRFESNVAAAGHSLLAASLAKEAGTILDTLDVTADQPNIPGLLNIYVCKRELADRSGSVYVQYPLLPRGKDLAISVVKAVSHENSQLNLIDGTRGIEGRQLGTSPFRTEVRFYTYRDQLGAFDAAKSLENLFGYQVLIKYMPRLVTPATHQPIEIWIGEQDPQLILPTSSVLTKGPIVTRHRPID